MIKYLVMDVDGTLTDGKIYMGVNGEMLKAFSVKDGYAISTLLKPFDIVPIVITARNSRIVQNRCDELGIQNVYQGKSDKLSALKEIVGEENFKHCAYFGDDILDLKCMYPVKDAGGIVGCPSDAVPQVKALSDYICISRAGEGALREFVEWILNPRADKLEVEKRINTALHYLMGLKEIRPDGKKHVVDSNFYYTVHSYTTRPAGDCDLISHKEYVEIQIVAKGVEAVELADISRLTVKKGYDSKLDVMTWKAPDRMARILLRKGDHAVFYPENAHRFSAFSDISEEVVKIVGKVRIGLDG